MKNHLIYLAIFVTLSGTTLVGKIEPEHLRDVALYLAGKAGDNASESDKQLVIQAYRSIPIAGLAEDAEDRVKRTTGLQALPPIYNELTGDQVKQETSEILRQDLPKTPGVKGFASFIDAQGLVVTSKDGGKRSAAAAAQRS